MDQSMDQSMEDELTERAMERLAGSETPLTFETAKAVYGYFEADRLVSRSQLEWVRLKLRKYAGM